jgi:hypothetical protein
MFAWWQGALGELDATVQAQGLSATGPIGGLYASELFQHSRGEATVLIPTDGTVKTIGRVVSMIVPAAELAVARHHGSIPRVRTGSLGWRAGLTTETAPRVAGSSRPPTTASQIEFTRPRAVCHAEGRGFESRQPRRSTCKSGYFLVPDGQCRHHTSTRMSSTAGSARPRPVGA